MDSEKGIWESEAALRRKSEKEMELKEKVEFLEAQEARYRRLADPWAHRSENMKCKSCMWFNPKRPQGPSPAHHVGPEVYDLGRCRRRAPTSRHRSPVKTA